MISKEHEVILKTGFYLVYGMFCLSMGVFGGTIWNKYDGQMHGCYDVWTWAIAAFCANTLSFPCFFYSIRSTILNKSVSYNIVPGCLQMAVGIWATFINYHIYDECMKQYVPELLSLVYMQCFGFLFATLIWIFVMLYLIVAVCVVMCSNSNQDDKYETHLLEEGEEEEGV